MASIYDLKPRFQALLRPISDSLAAKGVTANQVTLAAAVVSLATGTLVAANPESRPLLLLVPLVLLVRMALNAIDGMLAREHGQQSKLGAFLNELTDVVSDAALYLPFALVQPFSPFWVGTVIVLAGLSEFAGALGPTVGASRRYDGPRACPGVGPLRPLGSRRRGGTTRTRRATTSHSTLMAGACPPHPRPTHAVRGLWTERG